MRLFLDTDVLLDVLLGREEYYEASAAVLDWAEAHPGQCAVSWHGLANIHSLSKDGAWDFIEELTDFCIIPGTGTAEMKRALELGFTDLEDAMQTSAALLFGAQVIVTRNLADYRRSPIKALRPGDPALKL
ncbi:MAG: PIN domain-containing protein [Opitutales bacterium]|nr:PIN domain-containing protein [Opitutales bacterium]MCH8539324.1 PIN domain-containing protein [Opitutales bacterium]